MTSFYLFSTQFWKHSAYELKTFFISVKSFTYSFISTNLMRRREYYMVSWYYWRIYCIQNPRSKSLPQSPILLIFSFDVPLAFKTSMFCWPERKVTIFRHTRTSFRLCSMYFLFFITEDNAGYNFLILVERAISDLPSS